MSPTDESDLGALTLLVEQLENPAALSSNSAWELADLLELERVRLADDSFHHTFLKTEERNATSESPFSREYLHALCGSYDNGKFKDTRRGEARSVVERILQMRIEEYRHDRIKAELRMSYLFRMVPMLLATLAGLCTFYIIASKSDWAMVVLVLFSGAVGSVLSSTLKIGLQAQRRSATSRASEPPIGIRDLTSALKLFFAQPVIGATTGFILYMIFSAGLQAIDGKPFTGGSYAVLAFLAGFSEPFFIGILDRVAGEAGEALS
jgi:hypothetical protein